MDMDILLSHFTALEVIRLREMRGAIEGGQRCAPHVPNGSPTDEELAAFLDMAPLLARLSRPLETLVSSDSHRRRSKLIQTHTCSSPLPTSSAFVVAPGVRCISPEHLVVQLAPLLTELELIVLLSELLGAYAVAPELEGGMFQRSCPVTTRERLRAHLDALGPAPGTAKVRHALNVACVNSGSPRETKLSLRLGLKPSLGGYNFDVLSMNEPLAVQRINNMMRTGIRKPDILLRAPAGSFRNGKELLGAAVEYDGKDHSTEEAHARDAARHNELTALGLVEYLVTKAQYADLEYMDGLADLIRRNLGLPRRRLSHAKAARLKALRQQLYEELELIDGVHWNGRERERARRESGDAMPVASAPEGSWDVVPIEAYGLD